MGISKQLASSLILESKRIPFKGVVLELGRQGIAFDYETLQKIAQQNTYKLKEVSDITLSHMQVFSKKNYIDDKCFFSALGFSKVLSMDFSDYESANILFDLNASETPAELMNSFDVIVDGGTTEHVFHLPNAMKNITNMVKVGGRIIHMVPSNNYVDHGFFQFSPTFFLDYYSVNKFEINTIELFRQSKFDEASWNIYNYSPHSLYHILLGGLDGAQYGIVCIATKTSDSTNNVIPQQGLYYGHTFGDSSVEKDQKKEGLRITGEGSIIDRTIRQIFTAIITAYLFPIKLISKFRNDPHKIKLYKNK